MRLFRWRRKDMETERLFLRRWERGDFDGYVRIVSDPQVMTPAGCQPAGSLQAASDAFSRDLRNEDCYAIIRKEDQEIVGRIKYQSDLRRFHVNSVSIGYELRRDCWGRGYMTEALGAMVSNAFEEKKADVVAVSHYADNTRSQRVIEKCGFKREGVVPWACRRWDGKICDDVCYSILREDYFSERPARGLDRNT